MTQKKEKYGEILFVKHSPWMTYKLPNRVNVCLKISSLFLKSFLVLTQLQKPVALNVMKLLLNFHVTNESNPIYLPLYNYLKLELIVRCSWNTDDAVLQLPP